MEIYSLGNKNHPPLMAATSSRLSKCKPSPKNSSDGGQEENIGTTNRIAGTATIILTPREFDDWKETRRNFYTPDDL